MLKCAPEGLFLGRGSMALTSFLGTRVTMLGDEGSDSNVCCARLQDVHTSDAHTGGSLYQGEKFGPCWQEHSPPSPTQPTGDTSQGLSPQGPAPHGPAMGQGGPSNWIVPNILLVTR